MPKQSSLERAFLTYLRQAQMSGVAIPDPQPQYPFNKPHTKHAIDFAWPGSKVAVECEGGVFTNGRHTRGVGYTNDCRKYNLLTLQGWRLLRYTSQMLHDDPMGVMGEISQLVESQKGIVALLRRYEANTKAIQTLLDDQGPQVMFLQMDD